MDLNEPVEEDRFETASRQPGHSAKILDKHDIDFKMMASANRKTKRCRMCRLVKVHVLTLDDVKDHLKKQGGSQPKESDRMKARYSAISDVPLP